MTELKLTQNELTALYEFGSKLRHIWDVKISIERDMLTINGWITIRKEERTHEETTLAAVKHYIGDTYIIEVTFPEYNYPHEPDGVDVMEVYTSVNWLNIMKEVVQIDFQNELANAVTYIAESTNTKQEKIS